MIDSRPRPAVLASLVLLAWGSALEGRVVSYAPLTARPAVPAVQRRTNRHALLVEQAGGGNLTGPPICFGCVWSVPARLVLYDSTSLEEPRDATPGGADANILAAAAREEPGLPPFLLTLIAPGAPAGRPSGFLLSPDGGATWKVLSLPTSGAYISFSADTGGPFVRARGSSIRIGTKETPFFLALYETDSQLIGLWDVSADGSVTRRAFFSGDGTVIGMDADGRRALVAGTPAPAPGPGGPAMRGLYAVNADGMQMLLDLPDGTWVSDGWITPDGRAYVEANVNEGAGTRHAVLLASGGTRTEVASALNPNTTDLFAIPTADFAGAWILQRGAGPTVLSRHTSANGLVEAWRDVTRPEVEALHAGASGRRLLVQVHRPRPQVDQRVFRDPALAVWEVGSPAPSSYDELFVNEQSMKGFVHVDPDAALQGEPFFFDSGSPTSLFLLPPGGVPSPSGGGGADVIQEWGIVRGSLKQRLVIPATARVDGAGGSRWRTDVVFRNPAAEPVDVAVRFLPNPGVGGAAPADASVTLPPGATLIQRDVLGSLFHLDAGAGALLLTPPSGRSITATSRTYTSAPEGSYGMSVGAVDVFAGIGAGYAVSFAAGLLGPGFRTNILATDVSGRGSRSAVALSADTADPSGGTSVLAAPSWGQAQINDLGAALGAPPWRTGSLLVTPQTGETVVGAIAIDGATNDPTYFAPDFPATVVRTIPALVHADGAHGAAYRSDLFLFNPADGLRTVQLLVKDWSANEAEQTLSLTLLPRESKTIRDALFTAFGRTGVARLRFQTEGFADVSGGVRVTSRTWTAGPSGGSYGLLVPALNSFQSAGGGESLEILLPGGGAGFRTNLALVELTSSFVSGPPVTVRVEVFDETGVRRDVFETPLPLAGGVQIDDLFHGRGLGDGPSAGLLRISPSGGLVAAYASVIDNGTNDPMYVAAQLAASD